MATRGEKPKAFDQVSLATNDDHVSVDSGEPSNKYFFGKRQLAAPAPSHTSSVTWKSQAVKDKEEYERIKQRVRHVAPEQFKSHARPGIGPSEIFPKNVGEWLLHKKEMLKLAEAEQQKNCKLLSAQIEARQKIPKQQRKIKSAFGKDGKVFKDGLSPVLGLPTIWSAEYLAVVDTTAAWPSKGEYQWNADSRMGTRANCGRALPPPRVAHPELGTGDETYVLRPLPLDETGLMLSMGPGPEEIQACNKDMDKDPDFEAIGAYYLGSELMKEVGEWKPPFVPEWKKALFVHNEPVVPPTPVHAHGCIVSSPFLGNDNVAWFDNGTGGSGWEQHQVMW